MFGSDLSISDRVAFFLLGESLLFVKLREMEVLNGFIEWSFGVQRAVHGSLTSGRAVIPWRDLVERERRALEQLPRNADDIPTHIIPAAYPGVSRKHRREKRRKSNSRVFLEEKKKKQKNKN